MNNRDSVKINNLESLKRRYDLNILDYFSFETTGTEKSVVLEASLQVLGTISQKNNDLSAILFPSGMSFEWNSNTIPTGYLLEDGGAISRTTYADLFAVIGTTFGSGDGSTTFNLPNSKGRVVVGCDSPQTEFNTITKTGGHKLMQAHTHQELSNINYAERANLSGSDWSISPVQRTGYASGSVTNSTGGGNSENLQPYVVKYRIIKY